MITIVNAQRFALGYGPVGFLHPTLYLYASPSATPTTTPRAVMVNDILTGNNKCSTSYCCPQGFYAGAGWDPVTGFGSLNYTAFLYNMMALSKKINTGRPIYAPTYAPTM